MKNNANTNDKLLKEIEQLKSKIAVLEKSEIGHKQAEEKFEKQKTQQKEAEKRLRNMMENLPVGVSISTPEGKVTEVNQAIRKIFGYNSKEEFVNVPAEALYHNSKDREHYVKLLQKEPIKGLELQFKHKDGTLFWASVTTSPLVNEKGKTEFLNVVEDITELKQAEDTIRKSEAQKLAILDGISANIAFLNENLEMLWVNKATAKSVGKLPEEMIGNTCYSFWGDGKKPCDECPSKTALQTKKYDHKIMHTPDGRIWDESGSPVFDPEGNLIGIIAIAQDITEISKAKETVIKSEEKYRTLIDGTFDIVTSIDLKGNLTSWNRRAEDVFGYTANEIFGKNVSILVPKELINEHKEIIAKVKESGFVEGLESIRVAKDGSQIPVEMTVSSMKDSTGNMMGISAILRDITERKQAEEALEEKECYFRSILYSIHEDIIVIDSAYRITDINNTALATTGLKHEEVIGKHCYEVSHNYNLPCHQMGEDCAMEKVFETGERANSAHEHQREDGTKVHVDILFSPMKDAEGKVTHVIEVVRDITDIIHAQDELQESLEREQSLADIVRNAPMGIAYGYPDGRLENCNAAFSELTGYSLKELQDINWSETLTPIKWKEAETEELAKLSSKNRTIQYEKEYIRKDGKIIPIELVVSAKFDDEGNMLHYIGFVIDITERKHTEEELKKHREHLEELVKERTMELEYKNTELDRAMKVFVGRELKIRDLEKRIRALEGKE